ncbi:hypothetical protein MJH54_34710, partial [Salmonella enterica subsp. enterica serovar Montevideo]|nr:hypothetical protein [Salmonella enterica subsp. enterica serovar Montevideo]
RMPRMLGADSALEIIAAGKDIGAEQALKIGLVDGVVKQEKLITGLADALLDSVPVVAITGQVSAPFIGTDAFQEVDVLGLSL